MENGIFLIEMGRKIREARNRKKIPLTVMSKLSKIDLSNISLLERGLRNCHILSLKSIAEVLEMDVKDFF